MFKSIGAKVHYKPLGMCPGDIHHQSIMHLIRVHSYNLGLHKYNKLFKQLSCPLPNSSCHFLKTVVSFIDVPVSCQTHVRKHACYIASN